MDDAAANHSSSVDPPQAETRLEFLQALGARRILAGDSYKTLELKTGVPRSTLSDMLGRHRVPRRDVVESVIGTYAGDEQEAQKWLAAWSQLSLHEMSPPGPEAVPPPPVPPPPVAADGRQPKRRVGLWAASAVALIGLLTLAWVWIPRLDSSAPPSGAPSDVASRPSPSATEGEGLVATVYNVEARCQGPRTATCALLLSHDPRAPRSDANRAGEVWHGDQVLVACRIDDGRRVVDEQAKASRTWYRVSGVETSVSGWLPGVRIRSRLQVPTC